MRVPLTFGYRTAKVGFIGVYRGEENSLTASGLPLASGVSRMLSNELPQELHFINFILKMGKYLCKRTTPKPTHGKEISEKGKPNLQFEDLPVDLICTILSKLPQKEAIRMSVLSSKWRYMWTLRSKISLDGGAVCGSRKRGQNKYCQRFINNVKKVLQNHQGKMVEAFGIKFELDSILVDHLNKWVSFAVSARTKHLSFDLAPIRFAHRDDRYIFPFEILDSGSICRLQHLQFSFVSLQPPSWFGGFPNLRKLELNLVHVTRKELENMLCNCCCLEWMSMVRCHLKDELRIELHATKLSTFIYEGEFVPIVLNHTSKLVNAHIFFFDAIFHHAVASLFHGLPNVHKLTLCFPDLQLEKLWSFDKSLKFSCLKHIQLFAHILSHGSDKILYLAYVMRAAPFIEKVEVHFASGHSLWFAQEGPLRHELGHGEYKYLKNLCVTGFKGARGQLEFLFHVVENATALEVITVDTTERMLESDSRNEYLCSIARRAIELHIREALPPKAKLFVL
uniref:F-box domain-containing protein n=1 Tax=Oryza punctata TaxID=4537 RepID=A0A0E0KR57_ORYPU